MICRPSRQSPSEPFFLPPTRRRPHAVLFEEVDVCRTRDERTTQSGRSTSGQKFVTRQLNEESFLKTKKKTQNIQKKKSSNNNQKQPKKSVYSQHKTSSRTFSRISSSRCEEKKREEKSREEKKMRSGRSEERK